jgi:hypothetical protein
VIPSKTKYKRGRSIRFNRHLKDGIKKTIEHVMHDGWMPDLSDDILHDLTCHLSGERIISSDNLPRLVKDLKDIAESSPIMRINVLIHMLMSVCPRIQDLRKILTRKLFIPFPKYKPPESHADYQYWLYEMEHGVRKPKPETYSIRQINGEILEFELNKTYVYKKRDKILGKLIKIEFGEGTVDGKFIRDDGTHVWRDLTWNFHLGYKLQN